MLEEVIWWGRNPPSDAADLAKKRHLVINPNASRGIAQVNGELSKALAVIFSLSGPDDPLLDDGKRRLFKKALAHGCKVFLFAELDQVEPIYDALGGVRYRALLEPRATPALSKMLAELRPQPRTAWESDLQVKGPESFSDEERILLERAFSDCREVTLTPLDGGASGDVYQASVRLKASKVGPNPLPFFVKFDRYPKARREIDNYLDCTTLFVPFYARPNIDAWRCLVGAERGIIVGNFVEHSDSLGDLIARGAAQAAIASLFDDALRGWRAQAYMSPANVVTRTIAESLGGAAQKGFSEAAWSRAEACSRQAAAFGAKLSANELRCVLDSLKAREHRICLSHGDLHAENVRVRNGQAILIDFAAVDKAALVADPAALDASLFLSAPAEFEIWRDCIEPLYQPSSVHSLPSPPLPGAPLPHVVSAIRQIRRHGLAEAFDSSEYVTALAIYLFRHSFRQPRPGEDGRRRPMAFAAAERLAIDLSARESPPPLEVNAASEAD